MVGLGRPTIYLKPKNSEPQKDPNQAALVHITTLPAPLYNFAGFFCAFRGKLDFAIKVKTQFSPLKLDFPS